MTEPASLKSFDRRVEIDSNVAVDLASNVFVACGCDAEIAHVIADHLVDANRRTVESHGLMRILQYVECLEDGTFRAAASANLTTTDRGATVVDGGGGIGIPAMILAADTGVEKARETGIAAIAVRNVGHTGRIGAYTERIAEAGCLGIVIGGGNRKNWRQATPFGGRKALLPTNPYSIAIPGGGRGPVVLDFATSKISGGLIYASRSAGAALPPDCVIDPAGNPTTDPEDYFRGGAILPAGGPKGYGMALIAELIGEAMLGPVEAEMNWLMIVIDTGRYRDAAGMQVMAEDILAEIRDCPTAPGFDRVEVPGERERGLRTEAGAYISLPEPTWQQILALAGRLGVAHDLGNGR